MLIKKMVVGELETNTYFYIDEKSKRGFLIDPGAEAEQLIAIIRENGWKIDKILLTHGHFDHISAVEAIHAALSIPYYIHVKGRLLLTDPKFNLSGYYAAEPIILRSANYLENNEQIILKDGESVVAALTLLHTPGHTLDSAIYYDADQQLAFVGDTIFKGSVGSTSFPSSNMAQLRESLAKIKKLPTSVKLYPGHFAATSVGEEF